MAACFHTGVLLAFVLFQCNLVTGWIYADPNRYPNVPAAGPQVREKDPFVLLC